MYIKSFIIKKYFKVNKSITKQKSAHYNLKYFLYTYIFRYSNYTTYLYTLSLSTVTILVLKYVFETGSPIKPVYVCHKTDETNKHLM